MKQNDIDRAVAQATGESVSTIHQLGFTLADPIDLLDSDPDDFVSQVADGDERNAERYHDPIGRPFHDAAAA